MLKYIDDFLKAISIQVSRVNNNRRRAGHERAHLKTLFKGVNGFVRRMKPLVVNRFTRAEAEREHKLHQKRLSKVKPVTDVAEPRSLQFPHMRVNAKKKMALEGQRFK